MKRKVDPNQMDLFDWAEQRPTAVVIDLIRPVLRRIVRERGFRRTYPDAVVIEMPEERRRACS